VVSLRRRGLSVRAAGQHVVVDGRRLTLAELQLLARREGADEQ
jgi:hypothetical protein